MISFSEFKDKALIGLFTFIVGMMWNDIREMKSDIKTLIINNSESKSRIDALERQLFKNSSYKKPIPFENPPKKVIQNQVAILNKDEDDYTHHTNV
jgi:hypothetical protein